MILSIGFSINASAQQSSSIPSWIKNNAKWWSEGNIGDSDFTKGIEWLVQNKIIVVSPVNVTSSNSQIPSWVKNNAGWWASGQIGDVDFLKGIEYLAQNGIILIHKSSQTSTQPITNIVSQPVMNFTQALFPQQTEIRTGWTLGNLTLSKEQGGEYLEDWIQMFTNNNDSKKITIEITKYPSVNKTTDWYDKAISNFEQLNPIEITPDPSIQTSCWEGDPLDSSSDPNGARSTVIICQKDVYLIMETGLDNSPPVKQDMTQLAKIILNKITNNGEVNSNPITLAKLFPKRQDIGTIWQMNDVGKNMFNPDTYTYQTGLGMVATANNYQDEEKVKSSTGYQDGLLKTYTKHRDSGGITMVWITAYQFDSQDNSEKFYKDFTAYIYNKGGFQEYDTSSIGAKCYGTFTQGEIVDSINIYCIKSNIYYHVIGSSDQMLFDDDKQEINKFAQVVDNNIAK